MDVTHPLLDVFAEIARSAEAKARIALASTMSNGEREWVAETAFAAKRLGLADVRREATVGGTTLVDLALEGTAVEFKSSHAIWAIKETRDEKRNALFDGDVVNKLGRCSAPALMVITVVTLMDGLEHQRMSFQADRRARWFGNFSDEHVQEQGVLAMERFFASHAKPCQRVSIGVGEIPGGGRVRLGAVVGTISQEPASSTTR